MKLLMISGSRNPEGSTARMAEALLKGANSQGIPAERVFLPALTVERCRQCDAAGWGKCLPEGYCVIEDDLARVVAMMREADAIVFANPVYFGDLSESLRAFLDRLRRILRHEPARQGLMGRRIYVVDAQGESTIRRLTDDPAYRDELPIWSADGKHILFARIDEQSRASLWWMNTVTGDPRRLVDGLALDPQTSGIGYYGHIDWQMQFDWWRGSKAEAAATPVPAPTPAS